MWLIKLIAMVFLLACNGIHAHMPSPVINKMIIFGDSLSDNGNTGHLLKSINKNENPDYLITPFRIFIVEKMKSFGQYYHIPPFLVFQGIKQVSRFFDDEFAPLLATLIGGVREVPILPDEPYWHWHFSDGPVWNEYLASMLDIDITNPDAYVNQAFGGSWAASYDYKLSVWNLIRHPQLSIKNLIAGKLIPPSLGITVQAYLLNHAKLDERSLFFLLSGGNDYLNLFNLTNDSLKKSPATKSVDYKFINLYVSNVIESIHAVYDKLVERGAKHVVIMSLPLIGDVPKFANTIEHEGINKATLVHNQKLKLAVEKWQTETPGVRITFIDLEQFLRQAQEKPAEYGLTNTTEPCTDIKLPMFLPPAKNVFSDNVVLAQSLSLSKSKKLAKDSTPPKICTNPEQFLFWDEIHPTTQMHRYLAYTICNGLSEYGYHANCTL